MSSNTYSSNSSSSLFLSLPVELHLQIFDYCAPTGSVTIGSKRSEDPSSFKRPPSPVAALDSEGDRLLRLPRGRVPAVREGFHKDLLQDPECGHDVDEDDYESLRGSGPCEWTGNDMLKGDSGGERHGSRLKASPRGKQTPEKSPYFTSPVSTPPIQSRRLGVPAKKGKEVGKAWAKAYASLHEGPSPTQSMEGVITSVEDNAFNTTDNYHFRPLEALHLTCRQVHQELLRYQDIRSRQLPRQRQLDVYLSWPDGVCVAWYLYPEALRVARSVNITGVWDIGGMTDPGALKASERPKIAGESYPHISKAPEGQTTKAGTSLQLEQINCLEMLTNMILGRVSNRAAERSCQADDKLSVNSQCIEEGRSRRSSRVMSSMSPSVFSPTARSSSEGPREPLPGETPLIDPPPTDRRSQDAKEANDLAKSSSYLPILNLRVLHPSSSDFNPLDAGAPPGMCPLEWDARVNGTSHACRISDCHSSYHPSRVTRGTRSRARGIWDRAEASPQPVGAPRNDPYALLWSHSLSPGPAALQCIFGGDIKLSVGRGRAGNAIEIVAKCNFARGRYLSMHWPKMDGAEGEGVGGVKGWLCPSSWGTDAVV